MKKILAIFLFFIIYQSNIFACALCTGNLSNIHVSANVVADVNSTSFDFNWKFEPKFTKEIIYNYDKNSNKKLDLSELSAVKINMDDYIQNSNYLTFIHIVQNGKDINKTEPLEFKVKKTHMKYTNGNIFYSFHFTVGKIIDKQALLVIRVIDHGHFINFVMRHFKISGIKPDKIVKNFNYVYAYMYDQTKNMGQDKTQSQEKKIEQPKAKNTIISFLASILTKLNKKMEHLFKNIKKSNSITSYFWLLLLSFAYGLVHAIGPGHGKSLVSAYFLTQNHSILKALNISLLIGIVHTFSAFLLTLTIYYLLNFFLSGSHIANINLIASKVSAVVIIFIALYLIYKKIKAKKPKFVFQTSTKPSFVKISNPNVPLLHNSSCGCSACNTTSTDLSVILSAGIVPCPGTVTVFIFTMSLGMYFVGFLSAVFMGLGMSLIIFIMAYLSLNVRKKANNNKTIVKILEYGSLVFILCLGLILLIV